MKKILLFASILGLFWVLLGCGGGGSTGGGGNNGSVQATPNLTVNWPARTRIVNALASAQSVRVTLDPENPALQNIVWIIDRGINLAAFSQNYLAPTSSSIGNYTILIDLFAEPGAQGSIVGTGTVMAVLTSTGAFQTPSGEPLPGIAIQQTISSVTLSAATVDEGGTVDLIGTAFNSSGAIVPLSVGSFRFDQVSGTSAFSLSAAGLVTGIQAGSGTATATVDGITSPSAAVSVVAVPSNYIRFFQFNLFDVVATADGNTVYASMRDQNRILKIDVLSGQVETFADLSYRPAELDLSSDESVLYVTGDRVDDLTKFNTSDGSVAWTIKLGVDPAGGNSIRYAIDIAVDPTDANRWAIILGRTLISPATIDFVVYEGQTVVARRNNPLNSTNVFFNEAGTEMVLYNGSDTSFSAFRIEVVGNGIEILQERSNIISSFNIFPRQIGDKLVFVDGTILNMNDLSEFGSVPFPPNVGRGSANLARDRAVTIQLGTSATVRQIVLSSDTELMRHTVNMSGAERILPFKNGGFALWGDGKLVLLRPAPGP